jgi:hypothetical protein
MDPAFNEETKNNLDDDLDEDRSDDTKEEDKKSDDMDVDYDSRPQLDIDRSQNKERYN